MAVDEAARAAALRDAEAKAEQLFEQSVPLLVPGRLESEVSAGVRDLAADLFGVTRHWHKRIVRAGPIQAVRAMTKAMLVRVKALVPTDEAMTIRISNPGTVSNTYTTQRTTVSYQPPKKAEVKPKKAPKPTPIRPAIKPMRRVSHTPKTATAKRSRPWPSVPKGNSQQRALLAAAPKG